MLQSVATLISLLIAAGALAMMVAVLADDWRLVVRALRPRARLTVAPLPVRTRVAADRRAHVVRVSSQSAPLRAVV